MRQERNRFFIKLSDKSKFNLGNNFFHPISVFALTCLMLLNSGCSIHPRKTLQKEINEIPPYGVVIKRTRPFVIARSNNPDHGIDGIVQHEMIRVDDDGTLEKYFVLYTICGIKTSQIAFAILMPERSIYYYRSDGPDWERKDFDQSKFRYSNIFPGCPDSTEIIE